MNVAYDIMGNLVQEGDLVCSTSGCRHVFSVKVVRKITEFTVMYFSLRGVNSGYNLKYSGDLFEGLKVTTAQLDKDSLEEYQELMKTLKKNVATADNT